MFLLGAFSAAIARPAVIDSAAPTAIALSPKNLTMLVIVKILGVTRLMAFGCSQTRSGSNNGM
jgi:hypothetical protein